MARTSMRAMVRGLISVVTIFKMPANSPTAAATKPGPANNAPNAENIPIIPEMANCTASAAGTMASMPAEMTAVQMMLRRTDSLKPCHTLTASRIRLDTNNRAGARTSPISMAATVMLFFTIAIWLANDWSCLLATLLT